MQAENAIEVRDLTKKFKVYMDKGNQLKEKVLFHKRNRYEERWVLNGISFNVRKGEAIGLIGHNGCGKSTTLKLLTKIIYPDTGTIEMRGRVSSLIELGAGFHPDMSGRENIYTNAAIFGLKKEEIDKRVDDIIAFSELEDFIDNPVRTYSSGMYMRLAFSVAINVDADILLIDEILAVGDAHFQEKCFEKLKEIKKNGTTIVIVSHSLGQIEEICERSIWIDKGKIRKQGEPKEVHAEYLEHMGVRISKEKKEDILAEQKKKEQQEKEEVEEIKKKVSNIKSVTYKDICGNETALYKGKAGGKLSIGYEIEGVCNDACMEFIINMDGMVTVKGTNVKTYPMSEFEVEMKQAQFLSHLLTVDTKNENYLDRMVFNNCCERLNRQIIIHQGGIMYGPYITLPPMQYKVCVDVEFKSEKCPVFTVTKDVGIVQLASMPLHNGYNTLSFYLDEIAEKLEFVISNDIDTDILVKRISLI